MILPHMMVMPAPVAGQGAGASWLWTFLVWMAPFLAVYLWHLWHDHRHNHILEKRLKEIVDRLDLILAKGGKS